MNKKVICSGDGELYDAGTEELLEARSSCKDLCYEYNLLKPSMLVEQRRILDKILWLPSCSRAFLSSGWKMTNRAVTAMVAAFSMIHNMVVRRSTAANTTNIRMTTRPFNRFQALVFLIQNRIS